MTSSAAERVARMLAGLERLPTRAAIAFRGMTLETPALEGAVIIRTVVPTSRDPRVATENFTCKKLYAIAARPGRELGSFARYPEEAELVLLPGTALLPRHEIRLSDPDLTIQLLEELAVPQEGQMATAPLAELPATLEELAEHVTNIVTQAHTSGSVTITSPGKFVGSIE